MITGSLTLSLLLGCLGGTNPLEPLPAGGIHLLFIGNSLTDTGDLPRTVAALGRSVNDTIYTTDVSQPNFALIDHANGQSDALAAIRLGDWDYVILQQGPSTVSVNRDTLVLATQLLDPMIRQAGGQTATLMVWPDQSQPERFDLVRDSYQAAAQAVGGLFIPGGEAWRAALLEDPSLPLYGADGYHPGPLGTYLLALVVYEEVTGHDAENLPDQVVVSGVTYPVPAATARQLQRIAHQTVARFAAPAPGR